MERKIDCGLNIVYKKLGNMKTLRKPFLLLLILFIKVLYICIFKILYLRFRIFCKLLYFLKSLHNYAS